MVAPHSGQTDTLPAIANTSHPTPTCARAASGCSSAGRLGLPPAGVVRHEPGRSDPQVGNEPAAPALVPVGVLAGPAVHLVERLQGERREPEPGGPGRP